MKKSQLIFILIIIISSCSSTVITGAWKSSTLTDANKYQNILVAALTSQTLTKATIESDLALRMSDYPINVSKSIDLFPPKMRNSDSDKVAIMNKVRGKNVDAILTISVFKKETETRYVNHRSPYDPYRYNYYRSFWGYYSYWYPNSYSPDYYTDTVYYIETNLYDTKTENLFVVGTIQNL